MKILNIPRLLIAALLLASASVQAQIAGTIEEQVQTMYVAYYGRPGDPDGVAFWSQQVSNAGGDLGEIIDAFGTSEEYEDRFGNLGNEQLLNNLYQQLFSRDADEAGLEFYLGELAAGRMTLPTIALNIANGVQEGNDDFSIVSNRLAMAVQFTSSVSSQGLDYSGEEGIATAVSLLAAVGVDSASVATALEGLADALGTGSPVAPDAPVGDGIAFEFNTEEGILACSGSVPIPDAPIPPTSLIVYLQFDGDSLTVPPAEGASLQGFTIVEDTGMQGGYNEADGTFSLSQTMTGYSNEDPSKALQTISFTTEGTVTEDSWFGTYAFSVDMNVSGFSIMCSGQQDFFGQRLE